MTNVEPLAANHHAGHPGFSGVSGFLIGLTFLIGRDGTARLAADLADVTADDRVVDVGCGPGGAVREAASRGAHVTGIDPAPVMLRLGRLVTRDSARVTWAEGVAEALPLPDASATVYWSLSTVHHWTDISKGLTEAHRVLEPKGRLIAIERCTKHGAKGHASHGWTMEQSEAFAAACAAAGFDDVRAEVHSVGHGRLSVVSAVRV
jgi:ubiquinone/menaquinone biosynthesis C-methylase UbiE